MASLSEEPPHPTEDNRDSAATVPCRTENDANKVLLLLSLSLSLHLYISYNLPLISRFLGVILS